MSFKPDYGLRLLKNGVSTSVDHFFYDFRMPDLIIMGNGQYSTMVEMPFDGELHALSLDFNQQQLDQILEKAPLKIADQIRKEIDHDPMTPRAIDFEGEISFVVRARLGGLQKAQNETFVPLIIQDIS